MNSRITLSRRRTPLTIFYKGRKVGEIFRYVLSPHLFALQIDGVYWSRNGKATHGGSSTKPFPTMKEAIAAIEPTLRARRNIKRYLDARR